jgi:hypothetical protein
VKTARDIYVGDRLLGRLVFQTTTIQAHAQLSSSPNVEAVMSAAAAVLSNGLKALPELQPADPARTQG